MTQRNSPCNWPHGWDALFSDGKMLRSFAIVFAGPHDLDERGFEAALWSRLNALTAIDRARELLQWVIDKSSQAELKAIVLAGPDLARDGVVRWRRIDLQRVIGERFDVRLHERTVGKILATLGFKRLSVRPQHPASDPEAQAAFKKTSPPASPKRFPRTPSASRSRSGSRTKLASARREA